jgi:hypothetical protein
MAQSQQPLTGKRVACLAADGVEDVEYTPLNSLMVEDGVLIYRVEAQGCASWGVRVSDIELGDPPVVFCEGYRDGSPWRSFLGSFSLAAVEMVLYQAIFADAAGCNDNRALDEADIARLEERYERLPFPDYPAWWQPEAQQAVRWFGGPDVRRGAGIAGQWVTPSRWCSATPIGTGQL